MLCNIYTTIKTLQRNCCKCYVIHNIHKAQGSEYPVVIMPIFMQHYLMLSRNLIYTGLTRAKKLAIVVGTTKAIGLAVRQVKDQQRYTYLQERLRLMTLATTG